MSSFETTVTFELGKGQASSEHRDLDAADLAEIPNESDTMESGNSPLSSNSMLNEHAGGQLTYAETYEPVSKSSIMGLEKQSTNISEDNDMKEETYQGSDDEEIDNDLFDGMDSSDDLVWEEEEKDYLVFEDDKPPVPLKKTEEQFYGFEKFSVLPHAPDTHKYFSMKHTPTNEGEFAKAYQREVKILEQNLPDGMLVKGYEDRMDLLSAIIVGPLNTPYEGGLFAFDVKLPNEYPHKPPLFYFISFTKERMNPNLYAHDGKVCVSLLGTWKGSHNCERWSSESSLLQVLVSIQGLILVPEPYFNEPGYTRDPNNEEVVSESKRYNEAATVLLLAATRDMLEKPPTPWQFEITYMFKSGIPKMIQRYEDWMKGNLLSEGNDNATTVPDFPLLPFSGSRAYEVSTLLEQLKRHHKKYCSI